MKHEAKTLPELCAPDGLFSDGDWVESKNQDPDGAVRLIQLADVGAGVFRDRSRRFVTPEKVEELGGTYLLPGDVLIARMPDPLGRACIFPDIGRPAITAVDVCIFRPSAENNPRYIAHIINAPQFRARVLSLQSGTTRKRISRKNLGTIPLPIPDRATQDAIVEQIEKQITRVDEGIANLQQAELRLGRYRAAIVEACLPPEHEELPPGWALLTPKDLVKDEKYSLSIGPFGSNLKVSDYTDTGVPLVFVRHIRSRDFDLRTPYITPEKAESLRAHQVHPGDVLVTKMGDPPGDACVYPLDRPLAVMTADCIKLTVDEAIADPRYLAYVIPSRFVRRQVLSVTRGVAQKKMSLGRFATVRIPIPPVEEQIRLVELLNQQMSLADQASGEILRNLQMGERLRAAILHRAFSGDLQEAA